MALTDADKRKIEEEERYRSELRKDLSQDKPKKKGIGFFKGLFFAVIILFMIGVVAAAISTNLDPESATNIQDSQDLVGSVKFDGTQFHIANGEGRNWENCRFTVNKDFNYPTDSKIDFIEANSTVTIGAGQLTLKNGERFNPFSMKAQNFSVYCSNGFGYWSWD